MHDSASRKAFRPAWKTILLMLALAASMTHAQTVKQLSAGTPVRLGHATLFTIQRGLGPFTPQQRADAIAIRLQQMALQHAAPATVSLHDHADRTDILLDGTVITTVTPSDAEAAGRSRQALALNEAIAIQSALQEFRAGMTPRQWLLAVLYALLATGVLGLLLWTFARFFSPLCKRIEGWERRLPALRIQTVELVSARRIVLFLTHLVRGVHWFLAGLLIYFYVPLLFSLFPWTRSLAPIWLSYLLTPVKNVWQAMVAYLPNLMVLMIAIAVTNVILRFARIVFRELDRGTIRFSGFYQEWALPTYKIVRGLVLAVLVVVIFPYLPGSNSPAFKGISIFLGVLFSLGSSSAMANVVSGVILTYTRAFLPGDRVKIGEHTGDIIERTLLITRMRTTKNEEVTIPNSIVMSSAVVNYSNAGHQQGLILHTSVTIGYDAPWRTVHQLLISAALAVDGIEAEPKPYVLQNALGDFYVEYQINAYTRRPHQMTELYSALHAGIQDKFNEAGMEIMSPHYASLRDGNTIAIPEQYRNDKYRKPGFPLELRLNKEVTPPPDAIPATAQQPSRT